MNNILLVGSLNMDFTAYMDKIPEGGETVSGNSFSMSPGGKGLNQAIALARSGAHVYMLGVVGNDSIGNNLISILKDEGVELLIKKGDKSTGTAMIFVDNCGQNRIVVTPGANHELTFDDIKHAIDNLDVQYVCFQLENPISVIEEGIRYAKRKGKKVVLNPAPAAKLSEDLYGYIDYFTPNEKELSFYSSNKVDLMKSAQEMVDKGVKNLIVTLGEKGALLFNKQTQQLIPTFRVNAIDTVAAGDCFNGYLVSMIASGMEITEAIKVANKASSIAVTRKGASVSIPYLEEIEL